MLMSAEKYCSRYASSVAQRNKRIGIKNSVVMRQCNNFQAFLTCHILTEIAVLYKCIFCSERSNTES